MSKRYAYIFNFFINFNQENNLKNNIMNDAHLHMVVNHFPIIGTIFGLGILITGIVMKNNIIKIKDKGPKTNPILLADIFILIKY